MNEKQIAETMNVLRKFSRGIVHPPKETTLKEFALELSERFLPGQIELGLNQLPKGSYFPTLQDVIEATRPHVINKKREGEEEKRRKESVSEDARFEKLKTEYTKQLGEEGLRKILNQWLIIFIGEDFARYLKAFDLTGEMFLRPCLFDLQKAMGTAKSTQEGFEKFIEIVRKSSDETDRRLKIGIYSEIKNITSKFEEGQIYNKEQLTRRHDEISKMA